MGIKDAAHAETLSNGSRAFISKLSCSLTGETRTVTISPGSSVFKAYQKETVVEQFNCSYGLNEIYRDAMQNRSMKIVGVDTNGEARVVELAGHRFFIATLFLPQASSNPETPHPLIMAYLNAARSFRSWQLCAGSNR